MHSAAYELVVSSRFAFRGANPARYNSVKLGNRDDNATKLAVGGRWNDGVGGAPVFSKFGTTRSKNRMKTEGKLSIRTSQSMKPDRTGATARDGSERKKNEKKKTLVWRPTRTETN